jgi:hypothetical protein
VPSAFARLFTVKELAGRVRGDGARTSETVREWIARIGADRRTRDLLGDDPLDDVEDPIGCPVHVYADVARQLTDAIVAFVSAGWPS